MRRKTWNSESILAAWTSTLATMAVWMLQWRPDRAGSKAGAAALLGSSAATVSFAEMDFVRRVATVAQRAAFLKRLAPTLLSACPTARATSVVEQGAPAVPEKLAERRPRSALGGRVKPVAEKEPPAAMVHALRALRVDRLATAAAAAN